MASLLWCLDVSFVQKIEQDKASWSNTFYLLQPAAQQTVPCNCNVSQLTIFASLQ